jgi:hydrogenase maturation protease
VIAPVVIFAVGNPSRGDDAIGPECVARLEQWLDNEGLAAQVELIEDFQLQIEHALDLQGRRLALFIDAGASTPGPFTFRRIAPAIGAACTTHELPPEAVLQVYCQTESDAPPAAFVLCIRGEEFELGEPLSVAASRHLEAAFAFLTVLCRQPSLAVWEEVVHPAFA